MSKAGIASARPAVRPFYSKKIIYMGALAAAVVGSLLGGAASSIGNGLGSHLSNKIAGETLEDKQNYALEQMEHQAKLNEQLYEKQRDDQLRFSDPSFIRQRLEKAGLSPSLAFQGGASSPGLSTSMSGVSTAGGISSSLRGSSVVNLAEVVSNIKNVDSQTNLNNAEAARIKSLTPTQENMADEQLYFMWVQAGKIELEKKLLEEQRKGLITHREYEESLQKGQDIANRFNEWNYDNQTKLSDLAVKQAQQNLDSSIQDYDFNQSNNPLILKQNRIAIQQAVVDVIATEVRTLAEREGIYLTQAQTVQAIANTEQLKALANHTVALTETENKLRGVKKAKMITETITDGISKIGNMVIRGLSAYATGGASEVVQGLAYPNNSTSSSSGFGQIFANSN